MATGYESLLDQGQPSYGSMLNQPPSYASVLGQRTQMLDQTASGQALNPDEVAKTDAESATVLSELGKGLRRSGFSVLATSQAAAGAAIEPFAPATGQGLIQQGLRTIQGMPSDLQAAVPKWADVHDFGSGARYVAGTAGETLPMAALALGTGLLGRGAGLGVGALRGLRGTALETAANRASWGGGIAAIAPMMGGQEAMDISQDPVAMANTTPWQRAGMTAVSGIGGAVLQEAVPQALVLPHILGKAARIEPGIAAGLRNTALLAGEGAAGMYGANAAQSLLDQAVHNYANPAAGYDFGAAHEAGMAGLLPGALLGGLGGAGQAVHSNIAAGVDLAKAGVQKVTGKLPSLDDVMGHVLGALKDPAAAGEALGRGTLEGIAKAGEAAGAFQPYAAKGINTATDYLGKLYDTTTTFIGKNVKDPALRDEFYQRAAELKTMTLPEWNILTRDLGTATGKQLGENLGAAVTVGAQRAWEGAKTTGAWLKDAATGYYTGLTKGADAEGKASISAPDAADRQNAMAQLYATAPGIKDTVEKLATTPNDKRNLANLMHLAINDSSFLTSGEAGEGTITKSLAPKRGSSLTAQTTTPMADTAFRGQLLQKWQDATGTDLRKVVEAIRANRNDVTFDEVAADGASRAMHQLGINPEHHDDLMDMVRSADGADYDALPASQQRLLSGMAGDGDKARGLYAALESSLDKGQMAMERQIGEAGRVKSQIPALSEGMQSGSVTGAAKTSDEGGTSDFTAHRAYDEHGHAMDEATETRSPFDQDVFKRIMTTRGFHHLADTSLPVTLHATNADVSGAQLGKLFGERTGKESWVPKETGHNVTKDGTGLKTKINPMSLAKVVGDERFRNQFAPHMVAIDQRPGASQHEIMGQRFMSTLAHLTSEGMHIDPEALGLPKEHPLVHVKADVDLRQIRDRTLINQEAGGKNKLTWADVSGKNRLQKTLRKQEQRLKQQPEATVEALFKSANLADQQIAKIVYRRAITDSGGIKPTPELLASTLKEYRDALPQMRKDQRVRERMQSYAAAVREAYKNGDITGHQMDNLVDYYDGVKGTNFKDVLNISGLFHQPAFDRAKHDTAQLARRLDMERTDIDKGQSSFDATKYGAGEEGSLQGTITNDFNEHRYSAAQNAQQYRMRTQELAAKRSDIGVRGTGEITPETKVTTYPYDMTAKKLAEEKAQGEVTEADKNAGILETKPPGSTVKDRSAEVKTFTERVSSMLEMRRKSLIARAGDNPTLIDRINQHINAALKGVVDAAGELHQKLQNSSVGDLLNHYRPLLLKHLQPLEDAVTKTRSVDEAREGGKGTTAARYDEISKSESQDKVTFLNKRLKNPLTHSDLDGLMQGWAKKYLPTAAVKLHIYDKQAGDPRGFVFHQTGDTTIYLANQHVDRVSAIATMAHEFGHLLQYNHFNDASVEVKNPIMAAYNADVKALMGGKLTTEEAIQRFGNAGTAIMQQKSLAGESELQTRVMKAGGKVGDEAAFKEWFANQFSKMVTSGLDRPVSPAERGFWKSLSDKTKDFYNTVVKKLTPSTSYESWVKELARSQGDVTSKVIDDATPPPGKPPSPPPPPGPGEVPPGGGFPHDEAKKRFTDVVHSMMGDKKVQILFDQKLAAGVKGTFSTRREKLDQLGKQRVALVNNLKDAQQRGAQKSIDHLTDQLEAVKAQENSLLADTAIQGTIELATGMEKKNGLAEHETFHAAFKMFFDENERRTLGQAFTQGLAGVRLREIFKDDPVVLARIDPLTGSPEEAAAYAFQIWAQDPSQFQLGPKTKTIFQKMLNFVRKLVGSLTLDERAQMIMESLKSGRRYEQNISPVQKILDKDSAWKERAQKMAGDVGGLLKQGYDILLTPARDRLIDTENPALTKIARLAYQQTGEAGNEGGMTQRSRKQFKLQQNELGRIFDKLTEPQLQALHQHMVMGTTLTDPAVAERAKQLHSWYRDMYQYQNRAGVQLNNAGIKEDYYPLTWSPEKVLKNKQAFVDMLEQPKYAEKMLILKKTPNELYNSITSYIDRGEDLVNVMGQNNEPLSESSKARTLGFLDKADRIPFMDDDPIHTSFRYMKQAVRQAEYVRSFGENGVKLKAMKDEAKDVYGATPDQLALVNDYVDGTLGNKEVGMSRELKDLYGALNVYENYRLLPFNLFSSLIDPWGIAIRSNSAMDAWHTFSYSVKGLFNEWKKDYPRDFWAKYSEDMGIIEHSGTTISAHNQFDGITLRGTTKDLNDKLFKYNLLNGWVRNNTIMATKAGQRFIYRSAEGDFGKHSQRYLDELGLTKDDVHYDKTQNRLLLYADELEAAGMNKADAAALETKLGNAVEKFVRQSMLNPNSAELPNWMSNPYMAPIAHLKQFVFSFEATILARIKHEMKNDNFKPAALAAAYVPGMIAADFLKDMIAGAGSQPPYKQGWGFYDYFNDGVQRSGLLGSGQFFTSMQEDIARGGGGYETAAGPAAQQLQQGAKAFTSGNSTAIKDWMIKSMPLMPVYKQHFISGQGAGGKGSGGGGSSALGLVDDVVMAAAKSS